MRPGVGLRPPVWGGGGVSIPDTELSVEVLTPNGWRQARLRVFQSKEHSLGVGLLLLFQGAGITISADSLEGAKLAKTLYYYYWEEGVFPG